VENESSRGDSAQAQQVAHVARRVAQRCNGGKDAFVHISAVERAGLSSLNEGQRVSFDIATERGKKNAAILKLA